MVIGASAGGIRAIEELVMQLKPEMDAAFFIVIHLSGKRARRNFIPADKTAAINVE